VVPIDREAKKPLVEFVCLGDIEDAQNGRGYASWARGLLQHDPAVAADDVQEIIAAKLEHWQGMRAELQNAAGAFDDALTSLASGLKVADQTHGQRMDPIAAISLSNATPPRQPAQSADPLWRFGCHRIEGRALSIFETTSLCVRART